MLTENDIKSELSNAYVHAVASRAGFRCEWLRQDRDSIDAEISGRNTNQGHNGLTHFSLGLQIKATTQNLTNGQQQFAFQLPVKNYDDLRLPSAFPRILVVLLLPTDESLWLTHTPDSLISKNCAYWHFFAGSPPTPNVQTISAQLSTSRTFSPNSLREMMGLISRQESINVL